MLKKSLKSIAGRTPLALALALVGSVFLVPAQTAYADVTHGTCPDYRIMDWVTKKWKLTHLDIIGNHSGVKRTYTVVEERQTVLQAEVALTGSASVNAKLKFIADAKIDTGIELRGLGSYTKKTSYTWSITLPSGYKWVFYHGRRQVEGLEYGYHCHSLTSHYKVYTARGRSFSSYNYNDVYRCDFSPRDGLAKLAISRGC